MHFPTALSVFGFRNKKWWKEYATGSARKKCTQVNINTVSFMGLDWPLCKSFGVKLSGEWFISVHRTRNALKTLKEKSWLDEDNRCYPQTKTLYLWSSVFYIPGFKLLFYIVRAICRRLAVWEVNSTPFPLLLGQLRGSIVANQYQRWEKYNNNTILTWKSRVFFGH